MRWAILSIVIGATLLWPLSVSADARPSWQQADDDLFGDWRLIGPDESVTSVAVSPQFDQDGTIFIGAAKRVLKSVDKGASWTEISAPITIRHPIASPLLPADHNWVVRVSPRYASDRTVLVAGTEGAFFSRNGGESWQEILGGVPVCPTCPRFVNAAFSPAYSSDHMLILVSANGGGLLASTDDQVFKFLPTGQERWVLGLAFSPTFSSDGTIWSGNPQALLQSTDRGASWSHIAAADALGASNEPGSGFAFLPAVSPDGSVMLVGAQFGIARSTDGGETWEQPERGPCLSGTGVAYHPQFESNQVVYSIAAGCGVYWSGDAGATWTGLMEVGHGNQLFPAPLISHVEAAWIPGDPYMLLIPTRHGLRAHPDRVPGS
jgi:photosystem II stability/assembly factor-like uncharacterized protein